MTKFYSMVLSESQSKEYPGNTQSVPKKTKGSVFIVKSMFLRRISPAFLASGLARDVDLPGVRWSGPWDVLAYILQVSKVVHLSTH